MCGPLKVRNCRRCDWHRLNLLTYNVLTVLKREALPQRLRLARPKRLRFEVFHVAASLQQHARRLTAELGAPEVTVQELVTAHGRFATCAGRSNKPWR